MIQKKSIMSRRAFFQQYAAVSAGVAAGSLVTNDDYEAIAQNVNTNSQPSNLKITDMRCARIGRTGTIRLDTNQGISGYGEWYAVGSPKTYFLMLKSRLLGIPVMWTRYSERLNSSDSMPVRGVVFPASK